MSDLVIFGFDAQRYALDLHVVERIVPAVEVARLPSAPPVVIGIINVEGTLVPVLNIRHRFQLPERDITVRDQFLIARTSLRSVVLVIDEALGVIQLVFLDVVMPRVGGLELHKEIQKIAPEMLFLFTSGYSPKVSNGHFKIGEGWEVLQKSYLTETLLLKIREILDRG